MGETDPGNSGTNGDECNDGQEVNEMGIDPLATDSDDDGCGDCDELLLHGTDPLNDKSFPSGKYDGNGCATSPKDQKHGHGFMNFSPSLEEVRGKLKQLKKYASKVTSIHHLVKLLNKILCNV